MSCTGIICRLCLHCAFEAFPILFLKAPQVPKNILATVRLFIFLHTVTHRKFNMGKLQRHRIVPGMVFGVTNGNVLANPLVRPIYL
jgi:hypothetical protein